MKKSLYILCCLFILNIADAQTGIGTTTPNTGAVLDITSTDKGFLIPRVADTGAVSTPVNGMMKISYGDGKSDFIPIADGSFKYKGNVEAPYYITLFAELKNIPSELKSTGVSFFVDNKPLQFFHKYDQHSV